jgi:hypothetical protein
VIREAADTARVVQWDEKREGRTRNLAADYDYVHERCRATDGASLEQFNLLFTLTALRWPVMKHEPKDRPSETAVFPMGAGRRCCSCGVGGCSPYAVDEAVIDEGNRRYRLGRATIARLF